MEVKKAIYSDLRGQFRPIISIIEDIIEMNDPSKWKECMNERLYRLMTADTPTTARKKKLLQGNLCAELYRVFQRVDSDDPVYVPYQNIKITLKFASSHKSHTKSRPVEIAKYFEDDLMKMKHGEGVTEIVLTIDNHNIHGLFPKEYMTALDRVKRLACEMNEELEHVKKARSW
ncbi:hypothetical protein BGZ50_002042 [Haplosporangium sp. Z 11]|nr:hypothetical protein BGZ50_002042 [Haplosporangium sp. Z 11]